jgi:hypothetical protein
MVELTTITISTDTKEKLDILRANLIGKGEKIKSATDLMEVIIHDSAKIRQIRAIHKIIKHK